MNRMSNRFTVVDDDGLEHVLPTHMEVCPRCDGHGSHVNEAIDGNGLTAEDLADGDFRESYMRGDYDVTCTECGGANVVAVVDEDRCTPAQLAAYRADCEAAAQCRAEERAEARYFGYDR